MDFEAVSLFSLWLPILVAAVLVLVVSCVVHAVLPVHAGDKVPLPDEGAVLGALRSSGVTPGEYRFPADPAQWREKAGSERPPAGYLQVLSPTSTNMGRALALWFVYLVVVLIFVAYVTGRALPTDAHYLDVFQVAGAAAFLGFGIGAPVGSIFGGQRWSTSAKYVVDGLVYALVAAGAFGWLWPAA